MKIAFIGLGAMGFPMARHLAREHEVLVWNRTAEKAQRHSREHGTKVASDLAECASAGVIITMLPTSKEVDEIVDRLLPHLRPGTLWIDATSGDPNVSRGESRRIVDSISGHGDHGLLPQLCNSLVFVPRRDPRFSLIDSQFLCDGSRGALVVARQPDHFQSHALQLSQRSRRRLLYRIRHCQETSGTAIDRNEDHGLTFVLEGLGLFFQSFEFGDSVLVKEGRLADKDCCRRRRGRYSATSS